MLLILVNIFYILLNSYLHGLLFQNILHKIFPFEREDKIPLSLSCILGLAFISFQNNMLHLLFPINYIADILLITLSLLSLLLNLEKIKREWITFIQLAFPIKALVATGFSFILFYLLVIAIFPVFYYDEGLYYIQFIKWLRSYPEIKGLGNLHGRLAFNSSWHLLSAVFNWGFLQNGYINDINCSILVISFLSVCNSAINIINKKYSFSALFNIIFFALIPFQISNHFFSDIINSPTADFAVAIITAQILYHHLKQIEKGSWGKTNEENFILVIISFFLITVKFSSLTILLFSIPFFYFLLLKRKCKLFASIAITLTLFIMPWLTRNVIVSGYLVYPIYQIDLFDFDWKIPSKRNFEGNGILSAYEEQLAIKSWAKIPWTDGETVNNMSVSTWTPKWFKNLGGERMKLIRSLIYFTALLVIYFLYHFFKRKEKRTWNTMLFILFLLCSIAYWFFTAPDIRFAFAFLIGYICLSVSLSIHWVSDFNTGAKNFYTIIVAIIFSLYLFKICKELHEVFISDYKLSDFLVFPPDNKTVDLDEKNGIFYTKPNTDQCWNGPLPCTPYYNPYLVKRGDKIEEGFKIEMKP